MSTHHTNTIDQRLLWGIQAVIVTPKHGVIDYLCDDFFSDLVEARQHVHVIADQILAELPDGFDVTFPNSDILMSADRMSVRVTTQQVVPDLAQQVAYTIANGIEEVTS